jgi:2-oxoglutarate ferredoxin oxidoreductase subunit beta
MLATINGSAFIERVSVHKPAHIRKAKKAIRTAFETQAQKKGFSMVEVLSTCPTNWGIPPVDSLQWLADNMIPYYPLGNFRHPEKEVQS